MGTAFRNEIWRDEIAGLCSVFFDSGILDRPRARTIRQIRAKPGGRRGQRGCDRKSLRPEAGWASGKLGEVDSDSAVDWRLVTITEYRHADHHSFFIGV